MKNKRLNETALRGGTYSLIITVIVLAIVIMANVFAATLPTSVTRTDMSSSQLYSITNNTKVVVNNLDQDVTIYWIVQADQEDDVIETLLGKYESLSAYLTVQKINPDEYPAFASEYTDETVANNSLVVVSGDKSRYVAYDDIYLQEATDYYSYTSAFDGEGQITSAIKYVTSEEQAVIYALTGHGEGDLPETFSDNLTKANVDIESLTLLTNAEVPEDAAAVLIYAPESDISDKEKEILADYVANNEGKLIVFAGLSEDGTLENLYDLLRDYGMEPVDGIVMEDDTNYYAFGTHFALMPAMTSSDITDSLIDEGYYPIIPIAQGITIESAASGANVTQLLTTSETAYSKIEGWGLSTYDREDSDIDGQFALAVDVECTDGGEIIWFGSSLMLEETYNSYSSGANVNMAMNAVAKVTGDEDSMAIRSKSLTYNYLTISDSTSSLLKILMIAVFPLIYLGIGITIAVLRRRGQK